VVSKRNTLAVDHHHPLRALAPSWSCRRICPFFAGAKGIPIALWETEFGVYDLFDKEYGYPGFGEHDMDIINQDGRNYMVNLIYRFQKW
jgi:hypothetical protein